MMEDPNFNLPFLCDYEGKSGIFLGYKMKGVEDRSVERDAIEFFAVSDIRHAGQQVLFNDCLKYLVNLYHRYNKRCYVYVELIELNNINEKGKGPPKYYIQYFNVETDINKHQSTKEDIRFQAYFNNYTLNQMLPIYVKVRDQNSFTANVVKFPI